MSTCISLQTLLTVDFLRWGHRSLPQSASGVARGRFVPARPGAENLGASRLEVKTIFFFFFFREHNFLARFFRLSPGAAHTLATRASAKKFPGGGVTEKRTKNSKKKTEK